MTCIIGFSNHGTVYMGADSAGIDGYDLRIRQDKKVFKKGRMIFGFTSSFRMGQIIQQKLSIPLQGDKSDFDYMCSDFIDALRSELKTGGFSKVEDNVEIGGTFLVGFRGEIYKIYSDFQVAQVIDSFDACGCGEQYALGAMAVLVQNNNLSPEEKIEQALRIAERFSNGVRAPFYILSQGKDD